MIFHQLFIVFFLSVTIVQDFKSRAISVYLFPVLLLLLIFKGIAVVSLKEMITFSVFNIMFILIQVSGIVTYLTIKNRKLTNPFVGYLGLGDLLFWLVVSVAFSPANFILFSIFSFLFTLLFHLIFRRFSSYGDSRLIPLAGFQAIFFLIILLNNFFLPFDPYDDFELLNLVVTT